MGRYIRVVSRVKQLILRGGILFGKVMYEKGIKMVKCSTGWVICEASGEWSHKFVCKKCSAFYNTEYGMLSC